MSSSFIDPSVCFSQPRPANSHAAIVNFGMEEDSQSFFESKTCDFCMQLGILRPLFPLRTAFTTPHGRKDPYCLAKILALGLLSCCELID